MPGRVALLLQPRFLETALGGLPQGVVFVTGSNGKSTTTNMAASLLREHGLTVFTNPSGGNLPQGIASALLADVEADGRLRADIAVLEVDEAFGVALADLLRPRGALLLNVQVDQLDRFFEPQRVGAMLESIAAACGEFLVVNADDGIVSRIGAGSDDPTAFGVDDQVARSAPHGLANAADAVEGAPPATVRVTGLHDRVATVVVETDVVEAVLPADGVHYAVDACAALALASRLLGQRFDAVAASRAFGALRTVYGRGEVLQVGGQELEVVMMKNAPSLQLNLDAMRRPPEQVLLAVDEGTPDPSWFWGIDLAHLERVEVVTGTKAWQLATRLAYAGVPVGRVVPELAEALEAFLALPQPGTGRKTAVVNYEQMMKIRRQLGRLDLEGGRR